METILPWEGVVEFVTVVEQHSFTAAARKLGMSVAQVSRQVSALEARLATRLLYRTTRTVSVTEAGQQYYQHCRPLLDGLHAAEQALSHTQARPIGHLRLTAPVYYGETVIAPILLRYLRDYPEVSAELNLDNRKVDLVAENFDLGIRLGPMDASSLMLRQLAPRVHHVCASPAYLARYGTPHTLADLRQHACLVGMVEVWRFQDGQQQRDISVSGPLRCSSGVALRTAALQGMGLVQLPDYYLADALASGALVSVLERYTLCDAVWATWPRSRFTPPKVTMLVEYVQAALTRQESCPAAGDDIAGEG
ncbi:LysR family transcriptional regulator [Aquaspirillum sp. LM1]|uniref:LysR family transcriptional regulator n=1 Tax=Aquaspirillum sp. LM1 TaxID=1938604 RepID=UPI000983FE6B|nr:LysR family transcriptional regulator [Aquaspirillum sp. LM1]AQR65602.1 LysR family transcriptional regulator [Aquaspirillum sp. LM1]